MPSQLDLVGFGIDDEGDTASQCSGGGHGSSVHEPQRVGPGRFDEVSNRKVDFHEFAASNPSRPPVLSPHSRTSPGRSPLMTATRRMSPLLAAAIPNPKQTGERRLLSPLPSSETAPVKGPAVSRADLLFSPRQDSLFSPRDDIGAGAGLLGLATQNHNRIDTKKRSLTGLMSDEPSPRGEYREMSSNSSLTQFAMGGRQSSAPGAYRGALLPTTSVEDERAGYKGAPSNFSSMAPGNRYKRGSIGSDAGRDRFAMAKAVDSQYGSMSGAVKDGDWKGSKDNTVDMGGDGQGGMAHYTWFKRVLCCCFFGWDLVSEFRLPAEEMGREI